MPGELTLPDADAEWLETDGRGGFSSGTVSGRRRRRYHALLVCATVPPAGRMVLVNGVEAWVVVAGQRYALSSQLYEPGVVHPDGERRLRSFAIRPWPTWTFELECGGSVTEELVCLRETAETLLRFRVRDLPRDLGACSLELRLLLSGRDFHALHHENPVFDFGVESSERGLAIRPYPGVPGVSVVHNGRYQHSPVWYRNFRYEEELARGLDYVEDLASPGVLAFELGDEDGWLSLSALAFGSVASRPLTLEHPRARLLREADRRSKFRALDLAAEAYVVRRHSGKTIVAGYPWFGDWGRDTFIALRGLCLARGELEAAGGILEEWARSVSEGMLPNRFPDAGGSPEYNSVDAALWFVVVVYEYLAALGERLGEASARGGLAQRELGRRSRLREAVRSILDACVDGTRHGIRADTDGLLACGAPGLQLTWMDAKVGDWVVTPRSGKPVEVQALWLNALHLARDLDGRYLELFRHGLSSFRALFFRPELGFLCDVLDEDHVPGQVDPSLRPNQILAVGGLPLNLLEPEPARRVVECVERRLLTPLGLRSLDPGDPRYRPHYTGGVLERDGAYHQGTVWPWLLGPFVDAWLRVHEHVPDRRAIARQRFFDPLYAHLEAAGLGHVSEIADGAAPHVPRGAPFQAWSLGELLRLERLLDDGAKRIDDATS